MINRVTALESSSGNNHYWEFMGEVHTANTKITLQKDYSFIITLLPKTQRYDILSIRGPYKKNTDISSEFNDVYFLGYV